MATTNPRGKYTLNYFNKSGRIELCRLLFAAANVEFSDNYVENLTDFDTEIGELPYLEVANELRIPFIQTISRYLAREFNLAGRDAAEMAKVDAVAQAAYNIIEAYYMNVFNVEDMEQKTIAMNTFLSNDVENGASAIETLIGWYADDPENGDYSVGNQLSYADLFVFELAKNYLPKSDDFVSRFPRICRIKRAIAQNESIANFFREEPIDVVTQPMALPVEPKSDQPASHLELKPQREV